MCFSLVLAGQNGDQCHPWSFYNDTLQKCQCYKRPNYVNNYDNTRQDFVLRCSENNVLMNVIFCMTIDEEGIFLGDCRTYAFNPNATVVDGIYIQLPRNTSELNDFMCGRMNRKGRVCSECIDGFAPSMSSIGNKCSNCTGAWYGVPLYLFLQFVPITVFYLAVCFFQMSLTLSPMTYCVMYSQVATYVLLLSPTVSFLQRDYEITFVKILTTFHGIWNLDFFLYSLPPFCISPNLKFIHVFFLGYMSSVYPLLLIGFTCLSVQMYSHNFQPLVWLWNKASCLKTNKDSKTTIVDIFATFFLLSYTKFCFTSMMTFAHTYAYSANSTLKNVLVDPSISYFSEEHIPYVVVAAVVLLVFGLLPALLLALYPIRTVRSLILLGGRSSAILNIFVEKFYSCYRDGLDGGRDMRSFASLHLFIRLLGILVGNFSCSGLSVFFGGCCLLVMFTRPCKKKLHE